MERNDHLTCKPQSAGTGRLRPRVQNPGEGGRRGSGPGAATPAARSASPRGPQPPRVPPASCKGRHTPLLPEGRPLRLPQTLSRSPTPPRYYRSPPSAPDAARPTSPRPGARRLTSLSLPGRARGAGGAARGVSGAAGPGRGGSASRWAAGGSEGSSSRGWRPGR